MIAHFDPVTGAAGDMILAALIDAGADVDELRRGLATLPVPGFRLEAPEVRSGGFRGRRLELEIPDESTHRHLPRILEILRGGELPERVVERASAVFERLADAEARSHGIDRNAVHFHEVGALDAILDIAGTCLALHLLHADDVTFSPLRVGTGEVRSAHGTIPVPVPAVVELVRDVPIVRTDIVGEILTPTGAALLTTLGRPMDGAPFVTRAVGVGIGHRELAGRPNLLRVTLGEPVAADVPWEADRVDVLETNLDDMSPEAVPGVLEAVLAAGAVDAFLTSVLMKKGRPGQLLTVLAPPDRAADVARVLFRETTTFGVRRHVGDRWILSRESRDLASPWGPVRVKVGQLGDGTVRVTPEYESCRAIADRTGMPLLAVYRELESIIRSTEWIGSRG
ncbi:MAG TPA: nickel pincer cofactor biosynthesis protein LarC [bacterium]|nr:nickel pincer cofactor biosynthesis protein LarC [bacterium]